jgi:hypothetical protein
LNDYSKSHYMKNVGSQIQRRPRVAHPEYLGAFLEQLRSLPGEFAASVGNGADRVDFTFSIVLPEHIKKSFPGICYVLFEGQAKALSASIATCLRRDKKHQRDQKKTQEFIFGLLKQCVENNNLQFLRAKYPKHTDAREWEHAKDHWKIKRNQPDAEFSIWIAARLDFYEAQIAKARQWCRKLKLEVDARSAVVHERLKNLFPEIAIDQVLGRDGWIRAFHDSKNTPISEVAEKFVLFEARCEGVDLTLHRLRTIVARGRELLAGFSHRPIVSFDHF